MNDNPGTTPLSGGFGLAERALNYTLGVLPTVTSEAMTNPTPCHDWDVRALLEHMNDSLFALQEAADIGEVSLDLTPSDDPFDLVGALRERGCALLGAWANTGHHGSVTVAGHALATDILISIGAIEIAVHGWDLAQGCGYRRPIPARLAAELLALSPLLVSEDDRPGRFAEAVDVAPLAGPQDRLLAYLGRDPRQLPVGITTP